MKILIAGGAGFIGFHLAKSLSKNINNNITIIDNFSRNYNDKNFKKLLLKKNVKFIKVNLSKNLNLKKLGSKYSYIFNLAAILGVEKVSNFPFEVLDKNIIINKNLINLCKLQNVPCRFILFSTSEVYSGILKNYNIKVPTKEIQSLPLSDISIPRTSYALSKIYCEAMCYHSGINFTILRPHNIYGPRMGLIHVIPELLNKSFLLKQNGILKINNPTHIRAFCYIDDAIKIILKVIKSKSSNKEIYNIGNELESISIKKLSQIIIKTTNREDIKISFYSKLNYSPKKRIPNMNKTLQLLKNFKFTSLNEGCKKTWNWYIKNI